jgi:hypothetical protein
MDVFFFLLSFCRERTSEKKKKKKKKKKRKNEITAKTAKDQIHESCESQQGQNSKLTGYKKVRGQKSPP